MVSELQGIAYNTGADSITTNNASNTNVVSVNNVAAFSNATDTETDENLRYRLISARKKHFTLDRIKDMIQQVEGVRDTRVYQDVSDDRSSIADWTAITTTDKALNNNGNVNTPQIFSFSFYPEGQIGTIKQLVMYAKAEGAAAPPLHIYITNHAAGSFISPTEPHLVDLVVDRGILARGGENNYQEIKLPLQYTGLDRTKVYKIYIHCPLADGDNHWIFSTHSTAPNPFDWKLGNWEVSGVITVPELPDLPYTTWDAETQLAPDIGYIFKTMFGLPAFTASIVPEDGIDFQTELKEEIEGLLDYVDGGGYSPVCIMSTVKETTQIMLDVSADISVEDNYLFSDVISDVTVSVSNYLGLLHPGDDIIYSQIEKAILLTNGIYRVRQLTIQLNYGTGAGLPVDNTTEIDLIVGDDEYTVLGNLGLTEV